jgi:hypothetical protein
VAILKLCIPYTILCGTNCTLYKILCSRVMYFNSHIYHNSNTFRHHHCAIIREIKQPYLTLNTSKMFRYDKSNTTLHATRMLVQSAVARKILVKVLYYFVALCTVRFSLISQRRRPQRKTTAEATHNRQTKPKNHIQLTSKSRRNYRYTHHRTKQPTT